MQFSVPCLDGLYKSCQCWEFLNRMDEGGRGGGGGGGGGGEDAGGGQLPQLAVKGMGRSLTRAQGCSVVGNGRAQRTERVQENMQNSALKRQRLSFPSPLL